MAKRTATPKTRAAKRATKAARTTKSTRTAKAAGKTARKAAARKTARAASARPPERVGLIEVGGRPATVVGHDVQVGERAPGFTAQVGVWPGKAMWEEIDPLAETEGKVRILAAVPSLDTSTCDAETRRFNEEAAGLGEDIRIITISTDLPPAQKRWCGAAGVERVAVVSDHMATEFGVRYGTLIRERRWLRRAVFVVDPAGVVRYADYMPRLGDQPNYEEVLNAARGLLPRAQEAGQ